MAAGAIRDRMQTPTKCRFGAGWLIASGEEGP